MQIEETLKHVDPDFFLLRRCDNCVYLITTNIEKLKKQPLTYLNYLKHKLLQFYKLRILT